MANEVKPLTGLRWFAALGVYLYHFGNPSWIPNSFKNVQLNGLLGVQFFFVLSGYVLTTRHFGRPVTKGRFASARFARIAPVYFCGLGLGVIYSLYQSRSIEFRLLVAHILGLQAWYVESDKALAFNGPAWSVSVELLFYSLFPLLALVARRQATSVGRSFLLMMTGVGLGAMLITIHLVAYGPLPTGLSALPNDFLWFRAIPLYYLGLFIAGIGAAHVAHALLALPSTYWVRRTLQPSVLLGGLVIGLASVNFDSAQWPYLKMFVRFSIAAIPVGLALVSLHLHEESLVSRFLGTPLLQFLGKVSYAFYMIHVPFTWLLRIAWPKSPYEVRFLSVVLVASTLYLLVEQPARRWLVTRTFTTGRSLHLSKTT